MTDTNTDYFRAREVARAENFLRQLIALDSDELKQSLGQELTDLLGDNSTAVQEPINDSGLIANEDAFWEQVKYNMNHLSPEQRDDRIAGMYNVQLRLLGYQPGPMLRMVERPRPEFPPSKEAGEILATQILFAARLQKIKNYFLRLLGKGE